MSEWVKEYLSKLTAIEYGDNLPSTHLKAQGYPVFGANGYIGYIDRYNVDEDTVLISCRGEYSGTINYVKPKTFVTNNSIILRNKTSEITTTFLYYILHTVAKRHLVSGSAQPQVTIDDLNKVIIYYPKEVSEQQKITDILSTVDEVIEQTEAAIEKYQAIKAGMMQDLFTRGIDTQTGKLRPTIEEAPELYKESELGWIPKEWEVNSLKEVSAIEYGASPKSITSNDITNIPIFGSSGNLGYATQSLFNAPLIVVARKGTLNKPTLSNTACWVIDTAYAITPASRINCTWLYYQLDAYDLRRLNESTGVPSISRDYLSRIKLKKPEDTIEQDKIANILMDIDNHILSETISRNKYQSIKQGLMADLLSGKVRVNLNDNKVENG